MKACRAVCIVPKVEAMMRGLLWVREDWLGFAEQTRLWRGQELDHALGAKSNRLVTPE